MRILQLGKFYPIRGGVEKVMRDLTEGLSSKGIYCDMLCAMLPSDKVEAKDAERIDASAVRQAKSPLILRLNNFGRIICVKALAKKAGTMISPAMIKYLRQHCKEYDIIHVHHPDPMAALALRLSGYKGRVIVHWHSDIVSQKTIFFFYKPLQNWLLRRAEKVVGTSPIYIAESPHLANVQKKCTYVPIGILPVPVVEQRAKELRKQFNTKYLILTVGRLVPYKGYSYLIEAMSLLPQEYGLCIMGTGPLQEKLTQQIKENSLEDRITMAGYVETGQLFYDYFASCDIFVLPSIMKTEAFGIVQIEAMSCGKPVVATKIPASGVSWVNKEGVSGLNVIPKDAKALAKGIMDVIANKEKFGQGAMQLFQSRYTIDAMINKTIEIYEQQKIN